MQYKGYFADHELPLKPGDTVTIPKGTPIRTTGRERHKVAGRAHSVRVDHILNGRSFTIGHVSSDGTRHHIGLYRTDEAAIVERYGVSSRELLHHPDAREHERYIIIPMEPPTIRWAGTGGYWHEVDINLIPEVATRTE